MLEESGLRITQQRKALLWELLKRKAPTSHAELTQRLQRADPNLDRATIYRNLIALSEAGILVRTQLGDQVWRYELPQTETPTHAHHPHFVCLQCGNLSCLPQNTLSLRGEALKLEISEIQLRGRCASCARRQTARVLHQEKIKI